MEAPFLMHVASKFGVPFFELSVAPGMSVGAAQRPKPPPPPGRHCNSPEPGRAPVSDRGTVASDTPPTHDATQHWTTGLCQAGPSGHRYSPGVLQPARPAATLDAVQRSPRRGRQGPHGRVGCKVATTTTRKRTTLADLMAAAELGAIDPTAEVVPVAEVAAELAEATRAATDAAVQAGAARTATLDPSVHDCAIPGCRHGAAHGPAQPDRQVKLACPGCGSVARMTQRALSRSGGITCHGCEQPFAVAARRTYNRRAQ